MASHSVSHPWNVAQHLASQLQEADTVEQVANNVEHWPFETVEGAEAFLDEVRANDEQKLPQQLQQRLQEDGLEAYTPGAGDGLSDWNTAMQVASKLRKSVRNDDEPPLDFTIHTSDYSFPSEPIVEEAVAEAQSQERPTMALARTVRSWASGNKPEFSQEELIARKLLRAYDSRTGTQVRDVVGELETYIGYKVDRASLRAKVISSANPTDMSTASVLAEDMELWREDPQKGPIGGRVMNPTGSN